MTGLIGRISARWIQNSKTQELVSLFYVEYRTVLHVLRSTCESKEYLCDSYEKVALPRRIVEEAGTVREEAKAGLQIIQPLLVLSSPSPLPLLLR
jgi:hypothetical protein